MKSTSMKITEINWIVKELIGSNTKEFLPLKEKIEEQVKLMPEKFKRGLDYEISLAKKLGVDVALLTRSILSKKYKSNEYPTQPSESRTQAFGNDPGTHLSRSL